MAFWRSLRRFSSTRLVLQQGRGRVPRTKSSRRQLGISLDSPFAEEADTWLSCRDPEQHQLMQEMFGKRRDWDVAFQAYQNISNPEPALSTAMLAMAERCGKVTEALDLYTELRRKKELSARMFTYVIRSAGRVHPSLALAMLADMKTCQLQPNSHNYLGLLEFYKKSRDATGARHIWQQMREEKVPGSEVMLCAVMSVVAKSGDVKGTEALMLDAECPIITAHFNCCLDACHVAGDADSAFRILEEMQTAGCAPDVISYNSALGAIASAGRGKEERDRLLKDMEDNQVKPNELFTERHITLVLGIPQGAELQPQMILGLPQEAQDEARAILRQAEDANLRITRKVREVKDLLTPKETEPDRSESTDWVKVLAQNEAGSKIEYFWDRKTGTTQWEHPGCQVSETVSA